jgi:hypothetical protein
MTTPDDKTRFTLAAIMARSNMGMPLPDVETVKRMIKYGGHNTISSAVCDVCDQYMETDEHQQMFEDEARGWYKHHRKLSPDDIAKVHPTHIKLMRDAGAWPTA